VRSCGRCTGSSFNCFGGCRGEGGEEKVQAGAASAGRYVPVGAACVMLLVGICCSCEGVLGVGE
jgi:hypothetical protein